MSTIDKLFERLPDLPAIPKVTQDLIRTLGEDDADIGHLSELVRHDPTLSARVLRMANSSYYGAMHKIGSIQEAVTRVGLNALRTLVIASGVTTAFKAVPGTNLREFWHHALLSAGLARELARSAHLDAEIAYTTALMHRIGGLLLHLAAPQEAQALARELADASPAQRCEAERDRLGADHSAAGAELARIWNFPLAIRNGIASYPYPNSPQASPFAAVVAIASRCADGVIRGESNTETLAAFDPGMLERVVLGEEALHNALDCAPRLLEDARAFI
ncbi:HDOD domain-containing protein [Niveibacterium sp. SC-1]|uniref:HDOD domain-containing protein n=1 Tax=Niveibacterium sp. SC-1 TaxID=3135646 RepID=UPI00311FAD1B